MGSTTTDWYTPLLHVVENPPGWASTQITTERAMLESLAIGRDGTVHVTYVTAVSPPGRQRLWLATELADGSWDNEPVAEGRILGPTLAIGADGTVHIAYVAACGGEAVDDDCALLGEREEWAHGLVTHAWRDATGWQFETVADDGIWEVPGNRWLAFDSRRRLHLAYASDRVIRHAVRLNGGWQLEDVGVFHRVDGRADVAMAIGRNDTVHVVAARFLEPGLVWFAGKDGHWISEAVDRTYMVDTPSVAVRPDGRPCIAYYGGDDDQQLQFTCRCNPR